MRFYDSASATIREFEPVVPGEARIYYCGATVQGEPHLGHIRSALVFDQLSRWMRYRGLKVTTVRNVTDIDDKILAKSADSMEPGFEGEFPNELWWALAYRCEKVFAQAYAALGIDPPTYEPRATGHIPEMFALIQRLIDRGHAYPALDDSGDVYFDVRSWDKYGALTNQSVEDMQDSADADPRNLGAIIRSVSAFSGDGVIIPERRSAAVTAGAWKTSAGAAARIPVAMATNLTRVIQQAKEQGIFVIGLDGGGDIELPALELANEPLCVVVGSEGKGLSRLVTENCDQIVSIPIDSAMESLNAAMAVGITLYDVSRRRASAN